MANDQLPKIRIQRVAPDDPNLDDIVDLVARRMRATLEEVVGVDRGRNMYSLAWLRERVLHHLRPQECEGALFLASDLEGECVGHLIARVETEDGRPPLGLMATIYVLPASRRHAVATHMLDRAEAWFAQRGLAIFATNTATTNEKLHRLLQSRGYAITFGTDEMVRLERRSNRS